MNIEISEDQQMSIAGGERVNKLKGFSEEISSFQTKPKWTPHTNWKIAWLIAVPLVAQTYVR